MGGRDREFANVREKLAILRSQIGDHESLRLLESALAA